MNEPLATPAGRAELAATYRDCLLRDIVPFWFPQCVDSLHGGFLHCRNRDGSLLDTDKWVWAQGRMTWMLLMLYLTVEPRPDWLSWAQRGLDFLERNCFDRDGRMFFHVTRDGQPLRKRRYAYSESFAAIAHAAHAAATGSAASADRAKALFAQFVDWNFTPGKMPPKFTDVRPMLGMGPRMIAIVTGQELRRWLGPDEFVNGWIERCVDEIARWFVRPELRAVLESVGADGAVVDHFDGRLLNPGHAIEGAWFLMAEGEYRRDAALVRLGCDMLDWMWERGWDPEFGGLFYFRDLHGRPVQEYWHDMKFWWPHDEAILATVLAHRLTGEAKYARMHALVHDWSFRHFADPQFGEWYGYLHRDGRVSSPVKGNLWKSFFHHPRMAWQCWQWLAPEPRSGAFRAEPPG
ncbi:MAG: AGE family epimerase/isomerase [Planctomycetes bacterium]|nr:AGE family epimerase/isomerase [Planctomycetota bacterium]